MSVRVGFSVFKDANQSLATATPTLISFAGVTFDTHGFQTSSTRFTIPSGCGGWYQFTANVQWQQTAAGGQVAREARLIHRDSGGTERRRAVGTANMLSATETTYSNVAYQAHFEPGDYVELEGEQFTGGNLNVEGAASGDTGTWLTGVREP